MPGICEGHHPKHIYQEERAREKNERRGEARRRKMPRHQPGSRQPVDTRSCESKVYRKKVKGPEAKVDKEKQVNLSLKR